MKGLIVEDQPDIAETVTQTLRLAGWSTDCVDNGQDAFQRGKDPGLHLIIMDRMLPDADGLDVVERLRETGVETPVLMLTALGQTENKIEGYRRGADDYLTKPFEPEELLARIGALVRRADGRVRTDLKIFEDIELHTKARKAHRGGDHLALSPKEFDLLEFFMLHAGATVTRDMLLRHVWNLSFDPGTNVIDVNVGRLRKKLEANDRQPILQTVRGVGFCLALSRPDEDLSGRVASTSQDNLSGQTAGPSEATNQNVDR